MAHSHPSNDPKRASIDRRDLLKATGVAAASAAFLPGMAAEAADALTGPRLVLRPSAERGHANHGWLDSRFSFSFAGYQDERHMGFRALRVINEDFIAGGRGFPMHPHQDMEILTYVMNGALQHRDSLGNGGVIRPGEVQRMSAGRGIRHSEFNPLRGKKTHLMQIWMLPTERGIKPSYEQKRFDWSARTNQLLPVATPDGAKGSVRVNNDTKLYASVVQAGKQVVYDNPQGRHVWIQVARGDAKINRQRVRSGDGVRTSDAGRLVIKAAADTEFVLFDLA